jgi:hypothetical protein
MYVGATLAGTEIRMDVWGIETGHGASQDDEAYFNPVGNSVGLMNSR